MIFTLLPFLQHHYADIDFTKHFSSDTIDCCASLQFDPEKMMVVDKDYSTDAAEADLLGFEINLPSNPSPSTTEIRPSEHPINDGMPQDDDSISTLGAAPSMFEVPTIRNTARKAFSPATKSSASITSNTSGVTFESFTTLQSQLADLNSRLDKQESDTQSKLDKIFQALSQHPSLGRANHSQEGHPNADGGNTVGERL